MSDPGKRLPRKGCYETMNSGGGFDDYVYRQQVHRQEDGNRIEMCLLAYVRRISDQSIALGRSIQYSGRLWPCAIAKIQMIGSRTT
jgi:hypothetical protein